MSENINIDELLNSFIDDELSDRQKTEAQRLISHDPKVAERLREIKRSKTLVNLLPCAEAPADLAERVQTAVERKMLLSQHSDSFDETKGVRHLLIRKVLAAAAMIALMAALATLVYTIVAPESGTIGPVAVDNWQMPEGKVPPEGPVAMVVKTETSPAILAQEKFGARLELTATNFAAVNAVIGRQIEDNSSIQTVGPQSPGTKGVYTLRCTKQGLNSLLDELQDIWPRFDSATLSVETGPEQGRTVVQGVTAEQIKRIVDQENFDSSIQVAKDFAALNNIDKSFAGEILAAIDVVDYDFITTIPKPVLTTGKRKIKKSTAFVENGQTISLVIIVIRGL